MSPLAMTWTDLDGAMHSEVSQAKQDEYRVILLRRGIKTK